MKSKLKIIALYAWMPIVFWLFPAFGIIFGFDIFIEWFIPVIYSFFVIKHFYKTKSDLFWNGVILAVLSVITCLSYLLVIPIRFVGARNQFFALIYRSEYIDTLITIIAFNVFCVILFSVIACFCRKSSDWSRRKTAVCMWLGCGVGVIVSELIPIVTEFFNVGIAVELLGLILMFSMPVFISYVFGKYAMKHMTKKPLNIFLWLLTAPALQTVYPIVHYIKEYEYKWMSGFQYRYNSNLRSIAQTFIISLTIDAVALCLGCLVGYISNRRKIKYPPVQEELVESPAE